MQWIITVHFGFNTQHTVYKLASVCGQLAVTFLSIKDAILVFQAILVLVQNVPSYCGDIYDQLHSILHISYKNTVFMAVFCSFDCNFPGLPSLHCKWVSCWSGGMLLFLICCWCETFMEDLLHASCRISCGTEENQSSYSIYVHPTPYSNSRAL